MNTPKDVVVKVGGTDVNFGKLVLVDVRDGITAIMDVSQAERLGFRYIAPEDFPKFVSDFHITVEMTECSPRQDMYYTLDKESLIPLAERLAASYHYVRIEHRARFLKQWVDNKPGETKTLDHFYVGLSPEEIERSRLF